MNKYIIIRIIYAIVFFINGGLIIKAVQQVSYEGRGLGSLIWTSETIMNAFLISFVGHVLFYIYDKNCRNIYIIGMGFIFCLFNQLHFQLLGCALILAVIIFQFIEDRNPRRG